ncbi:hypothetical protein AK88_03871 [Plasmodium fragile]|uniref:Uncharacterized protein n=1 Tax=Plasmodium fragile TaxID=5857 RepID=A0A0D9QHD6_PLAFR|nr:uncharacterized protein AK88_03871 [Plasmodium fragile]KJP86495.1 hypothetical protein AK88_03871 [Plasmodium fragile]
MEEKKRRTKKIVAAEEMKATREDRVLRKFEDVKNKWDRQRQLIKERTKKRETLADQGDKYRERNELNTLIEHLNKEEKKKINWTENLRDESESITFKEAVKKVNLGVDLCKGNRDIFEKVFEGEAIQHGDPTVVQQHDPYVTNRDAKKNFYQGQIINKIKNNLEFVLQNFAIPLDSTFVVQGRRVDVAEVATAHEEDALPTVRDIGDSTLSPHPTHDECGKVYSPSNEQPLQTSKHIIRIQNGGRRRKVIPTSIELHNTSSSIIMFSISYKKKIKLKNEVLRQRDYLFFHEHKNYTLFISPNVGYLKPGEKKSVSLIFSFNYFVNTFGAITIRYLCNEQVFHRDVSVQVDSFFELDATELRRGDVSWGHFSLSSNRTHTNDKHEGAPIKNRLNNFFFYTKGRVFSSASHFANHDREITLDMVHSVRNNHMKGSHPASNSPCRDTPMSSNYMYDVFMKKILSESLQEAVKQYVITLLQSYAIVCGRNEEQGIPLGAQNKVATLAHENEHHSSHNTYKRGKESSRGVKGGQSPTNVHQQHIACAKDTFFNYLLRSFPTAFRKSYLVTLLHMALEQTLLTRSHSFYLRRYFYVIRFVRMIIMRQEVPDDLLSHQDTVFVQTNTHLLRYIIGFIHDLYRSHQQNDNVNNIKEIIFYFLSSAFLCIQRGVRNVILFLNLNLEGCTTAPLGGEAYTKSESVMSPWGGDFTNAVFHSFVFSYVRAFLSSQGKTTHYALHFVGEQADVSQVCEAIFSQRGDIRAVRSDDERGVSTDRTHDDTTSNVLEGDGGETPLEEDFFKKFQLDEDYAKCFFGESGEEEEPPQGEDKKGHIVFVAGKEAFARAVYEWHCGWSVRRLESRLACAQVGRLGDPSAVVPTPDLLTSDVPCSDAPTGDVGTTDVRTTDARTALVKKKTATGKMKGSIEDTTKKQKKKNAKVGKGTLREATIPHGGRPASEVTMDQHDNHSDEPIESTQHPCTNYHVEKLFEIFGASTYILDDRIEAEREKCLHVPEGVKVKVGMVASKMVNILPFVFNFICMKQVDNLFQQERHANYFLYDYFVWRNRDRLLEAMRKIVHYVDEPGDVSDKNNLFGKIPLPCDYDVSPYEEEKNTLLTISREETVTEQPQNHTLPRETSPKYIWILSPNVRNNGLGIANLNDMVEWLKLLSLAILMKASHVYICGELFFLFLFFMYDSGSLPARWCEGGKKSRFNQPYLGIYAHNNPTRGCPSTSVTHEMDHRSSCHLLHLNFLNVKQFPEPLLLLLKVNLFNILNMCDRYQIKLHFPEDMYLHPSECIPPSNTSTNVIPAVYCRLPHKNYKQMIQASRRKFLRTYGYRLANLGRLTSEALKGGEFSPGRNSHSAEISREGEMVDIRDKEEDDTDGMTDVVDEEVAAACPQRVRVCSHDVGRRTLNSIVRQLRGGHKVLWLCGAFERDPRQGCNSSLELIDCVVAAHKVNTGDEPPELSNRDKRGVVYLNNLIVLNEDVYALYHRQPRKDVNIPFLFPSHKVLVHLFDRTLPPSGFFSPF